VTWLAYNQYTVTGSHTYLNPGSYAVTAHVVDSGGTTLTSAVNTNVQVGDPTVSSVSTTTAMGTYGTGSPIDVTLNFTGPVTITGSPQITLNTSPTEYATYSSGSGTNTLNFTYSVQAGDSAPHLDYTSTSALATNGGTIKDAGNNSFLPALPTPTGASDGLYSQKIAIDAIAPTVTHVYVYWGTTSYDILNVGRDLPWFNLSKLSVVFSENVVNAMSGTNSTLTTTVGSASGLSYNSSNITETWTALNMTSNGIDKLMLSLSSSIQDAYGNSLAAFSQTYYTLPGDFNGDGTVNSLDTVGIRNAIGTLNVLADMDGDGSVTTNDYNLARTRIGTKKLT